MSRLQDQQKSSIPVIASSPQIREELSKTIVSVVSDPNGVPHVVSKYIDDVWDLSPYDALPNKRSSGKSIYWNLIPVSFQEGCKSAIYAYWQSGRRGRARPAVSTLINSVSGLGSFTKYLKSIGVSTLDSVRPLHIANYVNHAKNSWFVSGTLVEKFKPLEVLFIFRSAHLDSLTFHPWLDSSAVEMAGNLEKNRKRGRSSTPLIPEEVQKQLFTYAESVLKIADRVLDERDAGRTHSNSEEVIKIATACFYLLGCLTGPRSSEISSIKVGACRTEIIGGVTYHWLATREHKTKKGDVEFLMPYLIYEVLRIAERLSQPFRDTLRRNIEAWEKLCGTPGYSAVIKKLIAAKEHCDLVFLGIRKDVVLPITSLSWSLRLKKFSKQASVDWVLSAHQLRRLYGYTFVRHRLGNMLFLKDQFQHSSLSMTQLYASNPDQDAALYQEILTELERQKSDIVFNWLEDGQCLSGAAGRKIVKMRAYDFPNRKALVTETSQKLSIRSTGHSWCLSQNDDCGGAGIYEQTRCVDCGSGVIDASFSGKWLEIHRHLTELLDEVEELGPGAAARVHRDIQRSEKVLIDLGILPGEQ